MKRLQKRMSTIFLVIFCVLAVFFLYHRAHEAPKIRNGYAGENGEEKTDSSIGKIPERYEKEIPGSSLSFDADVVVPGDFDPDHLYLGTADPSLDRDKIFQTLFGGDAQAERSEEEITDAWGRKETEEVMEDKQGRYALVDDRSYLYFEKAPEAGYIENCIRIDSVDPTNNLAALDENRSLDFMTREQAGEKMESLLRDMGLSAEGNRYRIFGLDVETLKSQEIVVDMFGNETEEGKNPKWIKEQEGYYFLGEQTFQGLPVYGKAKVAAAGLYEEPGDSVLQIFYSGQGVVSCILNLYLDMKKGEEKISLAPFESVVKAVEEKYGGIEAGTLTVKKIKLMEIAKHQKDGTYVMLPVWMCYLESIMDNGERETLYLQMPVNAITGEEAVELEGN